MMAATYAAPHSKKQALPGGGHALASFDASRQVYYWRWISLPQSRGVRDERTHFQPECLV